jgi:ATP-dependent Clp protease protease subunit
MNELMAKHTGKPVEVIERDTDRDRFMSAQEALEYGIIDNIVTSRIELNTDTKPSVIAAG